MNSREEVNRWIESNEIDKTTLLEEKFDKAIIGNDSHDHIVYDIDKMIDILIDENMTADEAIDYIDKNYFSKELNTVFFSAYNKEVVDTHFWVKNLFSNNKEN